MVASSLVSGVNDTADPLSIVQSSVAELHTVPHTDPHAEPDPDAEPYAVPDAEPDPDTEPDPEPYEVPDAALQHCFAQLISCQRCH
jgi:hypothetical protein